MRDFEVQARICPKCFDDHEPETGCSARATVYCKFIDFYWHAQCNHCIGFFESKKRTHGSARQAADEVLSQISEENASATMRRLSPKQYEITLQNTFKGATAPKGCL